MAYGNPNLLGVDASTFENNTHTWVTTGGNTTLAVVTGQVLSGTYSLRATPTAAGSVELISPRCAVTAGLEYVGRIPLRLSGTTAGKVATARITWFDAASGGNSLGVSDAVLPVANNSVGWWTVNYPTVVGTAPAGAKSCTLKLTVSGLAAGEYVNTDDVYLCVAPNRAGNIYSFNTSGIEQDTSGWKWDTGTAVRGNWVLYTGAGYYGLEYTSAAAGLCDLRTNSFIGVIPGTEYVSYAAVYSPTIATNWLMEFRWYDSASNEVGTREVRTYAVPVSTSTRIACVAKAPTGAAFTKVFIRPTATAAGQIFVIDDASLAIAPNVAGNLLTYDEYSTESLVPTWNVSGGAIDQFYLMSPITDGFYTLRATPTTPGSGILSASLDRLISVVPGTTYKVKAVGWRHSTDAAQAIQAGMRVRVDWYDSSGNAVLIDNPDQFYMSTATGTWYSHTNSETRTCPDGAAFARVGFEVNSISPLNDYWAFDNIQFYPAPPEYVLVVDNDKGMVSLTVNTTDPAANAVTVQRVDEDGNKVALRGYGMEYTRAPYTPVSMVIEDYEAPLNSTVWYAITWYNGTAVTGNRLYTQSVRAPSLADGNYVWFKSPGIPALNTQVMMEAPLKWSRAARSQRYDVVGRKNPLHVTGARAGRESSITVLIWDPQANELFNSLLDSGTVALVQAMPGYGIDGNLYVSVGDVDSDPLDPDAREPGWRWSLSITEVDRPAGGLQGSAAKTWQNIADTYGTWDDLFDAWASWTDVLTKG